ncbi:eukaryotic translation initiation factor 3 subunit clu1 [Grosmannia clavigera kw1407]|uniref:Clustered mitochondria protein homolog n=1 Tax=Grosmannia clavigera (strain kw1407 / UAMH 11150) TaxID=655863 RepID=F0XAL3_GROCL|nr:eukaryotic translation initiation factor 3 subunit clu1 [Grosmannia clavigera kw1407]EFX05380.1 eukaryotic translation initiation factor 3 subunit clu1 [Grosmannia clavigera kw1407]
MAASADQKDEAQVAVAKESKAVAENAVSEEIEGGDQVEDSLYNITIVLPRSDEKLSVMASGPRPPLIYSNEQVGEVRQAIIDSPAAQYHTCFHLEYNGERINEFGQISEIKDLTTEAEIHVVEDPYTEKEARLHVVRIRDLIGAAGDRPDAVHGVLAGLSLFDSVTVESLAAAEVAPVEADFGAVADVNVLLPRASAEEAAGPKTVKAIQLSPWNPPPVYLRQKGHLMYLIVTTLEGEQFQITSHVGGFYVNKSSNSKFDPGMRPGAKACVSHSLLALIEKISPSFAAVFAALQEQNGRRDPLSTFQITNATPAAPWLVPGPTTAAGSTYAHVADITRTQESFLVAGSESVENLRDWNEELQSARELPRETVQDRIFRERLVSKVFADYVDAATRGAILVANGEVGALNPTEDRDAQIFVYNNIFFSFGADGVGTFTSEGGDEAARMATGKDVAGVRRVNQLDIDGLYSPGTVVVDYLGKRVVGQSLVPGIFKQREPGENQIDYGAVDGKDVVAADERFVEPFAKLSQALSVRRHPVWDKDGRRVELEGSVETKGLIGTDGRKYVLDLYRITPLDVAWQEESDGLADDEATAYPHRMTVLRPELVDIYSRVKMREWLDDEQMDRIDVSDFKFSLNPDVFSGQVPQTDEEKEQLAADEKEVRAVCQHLREVSIPALISDLNESEISFPMDGRSLSSLLHKRGINMRYLGRIAELSKAQTRLECLHVVTVREIVSRAFKHVSAKYLRYLPQPLSSAAIAHLLNCLLGSGLNSTPTAYVEPSLRGIYDDEDVDADVDFKTVTPASLKAAIEAEALRRFRFALPADWQSELTGQHLQLLREVSLKLGLQLASKKYVFTEAEAKETETTKTNGTATASATATSSATTATTAGEGSKKKKKKAAAGRDGSPSSLDEEAKAAATRPEHTFWPDDIVNVVPVIKDSAPRSALAEEAMEAGKISLSQGQKKIGQELLLESLSLHEQIYGILHPEVAHAYHTLAMLYYQMDDKEAAVELARKAIIVSERVIGLDSQETLLNYLNLALFVHQQGKSALGLAYAKHALRLWRVLYGPDHPDAITTVNNAAVMLQSIKAYHESRRWFEESLRMSEAVFGRASLNSATLLFQLAQALALDQDSKGAVARMRESYNVFLAELGPDDKNTKEAESWLEQLIHNAVSIAKHAKHLETRRIRAGIRFPPTSTPRSDGAGARASGVAAPTTTAAAEAAAKPALDSRSIDELIRFIEGTDSKNGKTGAGSSSKKRGSGRANPKRRSAPTA